MEDNGRCAMKVLTVVLRNNSPMLYAGDPPTHRTIHVPLTDQQLQMIEPLKVGHNCGTDVFEEIAMCFFGGGAR